MAMARGTRSRTSFDGLVDIPTGAVVMSPGYGPTVSKFTAPASGIYTLSATMTDPYFDPFNGPVGGNDGDDAWTWDDRPVRLLDF